MENHSKYGQFIYTHDGTSTLYVNLFTASTLSSTQFMLKQETSFPFSDESTITVNTAGAYTIAIRHPWWTTSGYKIYINDEEQSISVSAGTASYVSLYRSWAIGDVIKVVVPMELRYTTLPNYTDYIAFQYGPMLLAAQTSTDDSDEATTKHLYYEASLQNEYGTDGRMDHAPDSRALKRSLTSAPLLIGDRDGESGVLTKISTTDRSALTFSLNASRENADSYTWTTLTLQPFYQIHHARYSCYWYQQTAANYANSTMAAEEAAAAAIESRTLDYVTPGEQQSEAGHETYYSSSSTGTYNNEHYRDASSGGYVQYTLSYESEEPETSGLSVLLRFTSADAGRKATLYVDGTKVSGIMSIANFNGQESTGFYNVEFPIPASLMTDESGTKTSFVVKVAADRGTLIPGLYGVRLMKEYTATELPETVTTTADNVRTVIDGVATGGNGQDEMVHEFEYTGANTSEKQYGTYKNKYWRDALAGYSYSYNLATDGNTEGVSLVVEYWYGDASRLSNIDIDGVTIAAQECNSVRSGFVIMEYPIDETLLEGKTKVNVKFTGAGSDWTIGSYNVYLTKGRSTTARSKTAYTFVNTNFEKNGTDGNISTFGTSTEGQITVTGTAATDYGLNMRMNKNFSGTYSIMPTQYLLAIKGTNLGTTANLWWIMGCNNGASTSPTYTYTDDDSNTYLVWDLRKAGNFTDSEKNARFYGIDEVEVSTSNSGDYSLLCFGLTTTDASTYTTTISDISFYSPEELVDKYSVLSSTISSLKTSLATDSVFVYGDYKYQVANASTLQLTGMLSTGSSIGDAPSTLFGYTVSSDVYEKKQTIISNKGDCTSMLTNTTFDSGVDGWTFVNDKENDATAIARYNGSSWRGGNNYYVDCNNRWYTISQTLSNMPAGTYKLVAAMRGKRFGIRPSLAGTNGSYWYGTSSTMINKNGVQMPVADITKNNMNYASDGGTQWNWVSTTASLAASGDLTISFKMEANSGCWCCLDDIHLYCTSLDGTSYTTSLNDISENTSVSNSGNAEVVTCDITMTNPNAIVTSDATITTASGATLNNNLVEGTVSSLVLYDGYEFVADEDFTATDATLYRSIAAGKYVTMCAPFAITGGHSGTFYQPTSLDEKGTLEFGTESTPAAGKAYVLYTNETAVTAITGSGTVKADPVDNGTGVTMKGTYSNIAAIDYDDYVLSSNSLWKVNSTVTLAPFRAYFTVPEGVDAARINLNFDGGETDVNSIPTVLKGEELRDGKYLDDGRIVIVRNGKKYNTNGQQK